MSLSERLFQGWFHLQILLLHWSPHYCSLLRPLHRARQEWTALLCSALLWAATALLSRFTTSLLGTAPILHLWLLLQLKFELLVFDRQTLCIAAWCFTTRPPSGCQFQPRNFQMSCVSEILYKKSHLFPKPRYLRSKLASYISIKKKTFKASSTFIWTCQNGKHLLPASNDTYAFNLLSTLQME
jgi:hypothetical protein